MSPFRFIMLGVGDAFAALTYSTSLALVAEDGSWLLVDCPHPIHKILREAALASGIPLPLERLVGVALTHLHSDHCSGLEGLGYFTKYIRPSLGEIPLVAGQLVADEFRNRPEASCFRLVASAEAEVEFGPFRLATRRVTHGQMNAYAYQFSCASRTLGHSGDTKFDPDLIQWLAKSDSFIHEMGISLPGTDIHTSPEELLSLPEAVRAKMLVAHYADSITAVPGLAMLRQFQVVEMP